MMQDAGGSRISEGIQAAALVGTAMDAQDAVQTLCFFIDRPVELVPQVQRKAEGR
jgi:hypothetical protein